MNKNQIRGIRCRTSGLLIAKSTSIKGAGCRSGGCALKAVELTSGGLLHVPESGLRREQCLQQKSAAGIVAAQVAKAQTEGSGK